MPFIHVYGFERPVEKKRELAKELTAAMCKVYGVAPEIVTVYMFDVPKSNAAHAGILEFDRPENKPGRV